MQPDERLIGYLVADYITTEDWVFRNRLEHSELVEIAQMASYRAYLLAKVNIYVSDIDLLILKGTLYCATRGKVFIHGEQET